jgi:hypothetical protein
MAREVTIFRQCRWSLRHPSKGTWHCKLPALREGRPFADLDAAGCPDPCPDFEDCPWKSDLYGDEYEEKPPTPQEIEWEDEP